MKKHILIVLLTALLSSCSVDVEKNEVNIVKMPADFTKEQTQELVQRSVNAELYEKITARFPDVSKQNPGRFDYKPILLMDGVKKSDRQYAIMVEITGLEGWDRRDEFQSFLVEHLEDSLEQFSQPGA